MLHHVIGDLLNAPEPVIVQQLNCLCVRPHGLSDLISKKYPYADVYRQRRAEGSANLAILEDRGVPGKIVISHPPQKFEPNSSQSQRQGQSPRGVGGKVQPSPPIIIGLYGQYDYGKPGYSAKRSTLETDNYVLRSGWFSESLNNLKMWLIENKISAVAFPYMIGCGLAGGNWKEYEQMLEQFATGVPYKVVIYHLQ